MTSYAENDPYRPISDYGIIGDMHSCALISRDGSIDWCCFPRFDSPSLFGRLLDWRDGGYFQIAPRDTSSISRRYVERSNVLETTFETPTGVARLTDFMPTHHHSDPGQPLEINEEQRVVRILECVSGSISFVLECFPRFDYGTIVPHAALDGPHTGFAHGGADGLGVYSSAPMETVDDGFRSEGKLQKGEKVFAAVTYRPCFSHVGRPLDNDELEIELGETIQFWRHWCATCTYQGEYQAEVVRSALTIKALTYAPSGALLAAATTSLPEVIGGARNWDYRYTWVRDAAFALYALSLLGYRNEARAFKEWLEWSTAGRARDLQVMYGLGGERRLTEVELVGLEGYRRSRPVRIGNAAYSQFQLDIYGELMDSAHMYRKFVDPIDQQYWSYLLRVVSFVIDHWRETDEGIWETRGEQEHFVFSKVMCWVALDRAIKAARAQGLPGDVEMWHKVRAEIREDVLKKGYNPQKGAFVQCYGSDNLDAANLMLPLVGFIRADEPRMLSTIRAIENELTAPNGFVRRYTGYDDGLGGSEGTFTICTFWLADNLIMLGELDRARALFDKLRACANDLGLFSEELDTKTGEMLGNFPQSFSHMALINTAVQLYRAEHPADDGRP